MMIQKLREVDKLQNEILEIKNGLNINRDKREDETTKYNDPLQKEKEEENYFNRNSSEEGTPKMINEEKVNKGNANKTNKMLTNKITIINEESEDGIVTSNKPKAYLDVGYRRTNSPDKKRLSEIVTSKPRYNIAINTCTEEMVDPKDSFYVTDSNFDPNAPQPEIPKKNQSQKQLVRTSTLENRFNEMIANDEFESVIDKLNIDKFLKKQ